MDTTPISNEKFGRPIIKTRVRILRPDEWEVLRESAGSLSESNQVNLDALLLTGLRYVEAQRLQSHEDWFDGKKFIFLPEEAILKHLRNQKERWIRLNPLGVEAIKRFFENRKLPATQNWGVDLRRWASRAGLEPKALGPKTTRKTWESWLMATYPERSDQIVLSQGHNKATSLHHYLNMPFEDADFQRMKKWTEGLF
jgi:integrase